eukprot:TRINITY_DN14998_c0_g1_i1.p1 TRINITY_DN14998_c0_g1~~TRINITY_DN14998_c0_g1_i1.p1  ORF type:complete len:511 (+),score=34.21 TRINITY_DN14998_c0_g1_i1:259-1791(+)
MCWCCWWTTWGTATSLASGAPTYPHPTGRYAIRTGCVGVEEARRVIPTPTNPGGLDPDQHLSIATALKHAGYRTGMAGKWHLGLSSKVEGQDPNYKFVPNSHGYDTYLGSPFTNTPACAMDAEGISQKAKNGPNVCFLMANRTVVQQPLHLENFTSTITQHALNFISSATHNQPWFFFMSYFHVHTPLFTNRNNRGRSTGGEFGDNVEELDDSVGEILQAVQVHGFSNNTLILLTSDNGPYQEEGWANSGRTSLYDEHTGALLGRLKGGKGQLYEGGVRMPGIAVWDGVVQPASRSDVMVSSLDIFPTVLAAAGVSLGANYTIDGRDMAPVLQGSNQSQHDVFLHYCGFDIIGARVLGRWKVFWKVQKWYTHETNLSVCAQCCSGVNPLSRLTPIRASELCGCGSKDLVVLPSPVVYDMLQDSLEEVPLTRQTLPRYDQIVRLASAAKSDMEKSVHPRPDLFGAGTCTAGLPSSSRQPCCPGCAKPGLLHNLCHDGQGNHCSCDNVPTHV